MSPTQALEAIKDYIYKSGYNINKIVVVTKNHSYSIIQLLYDYGHSDFGENKVQEAEKKFSLIQARQEIPLYKHHIGPFQSGNARKIVQVFDWVQGVSSISGLETLIDSSKKNFEKSQKKIFYLIQLNLTMESTKLGGMLLEEFEQALEKKPELFRDFPYLEWKGFMTMGPSDGDPILTRKVFQQLRKIRDQWKPDGELSMGMSNDWKIALEEGATILRIGSAIVGSRT